MTILTAGPFLQPPIHSSQRIKIFFKRTRHVDTDTDRLKVEGEGLYTSQGKRHTTEPLLSRRKESCSWPDLRFLTRTVRR